MAGVSLSPNNDSSLLTVAVVSTTTTSTSIVAAKVNTIFRVYKMFLVAATASTITIEDGTTPLCGGLPLAANGSITLDMDGCPWFTTSMNSPLTLANSGGVQVSGTIYYTATQF